MVDSYDLAAFVGKTERDLARHFAGVAGVAPSTLELAARSAFLEHVESVGINGFPDAKSLIDRLDHQAAVASNSFRWRLDAVLGAVGLSDLISRSVPADEVAHPKPAPDVYLAACRLLAVDPSNVLVIEDSPTGIEAGLVAGCTVVAIDRGWFRPEQLTRAHQVVTSLEQAW